jgi:hypothetical protein
MHRKRLRWLLPRRKRRSMLRKAAPVGEYNGPGGCAASSCHGSVQPKTTTPIFQNEYTIWIAQDKHARAYGVLRNKVSERIGQTLNLGRPPSEAPRCLVCHSLYVSPEQQAQTFELGDGVSCENCHGPASGWLGAHTTKNWPHEKSVPLGMYDTRNLEAAQRQMPDLPSWNSREICRSRDDRGGTSRSYF